MKGMCTNAAVVAALLCRQMGGPGQFIDAATFEDKVVRAYLLAFLISEGRALLKTDPLSGKIWTMPLADRVKGLPKSVAISITGEA
jgi:crotonobetainyl-CoA:carnitine CoA-transferase CaiB-like acyl-CoA transferase